jgi:hypothetical protein
VSQRLGNGAVRDPRLRFSTEQAGHAGTDRTQSAGAAGESRRFEVDEQQAVAARRAREQIERGPRPGRRRKAVSDGHVSVTMTGRIPALDDDIPMARRFVPGAAQNFSGIVRGPIVRRV